jgi:hypothetical protein
MHKPDHSPFLRLQAAPRTTKANEANEDLRALGSELDFPAQPVAG